ncbi:hypothetical protein FM112_07400 [Gulosibacter sp. 10]|nr:hypothetical protein FM112_07400 [Gulosibacter sp. 10]
MQAWERRGVQRGEWRRSRWRQRDTAVCILIVVVSLTTFSTRFFG